MAMKIKMLRERIIPVLYEMGETGKIYKVNNEVAEELVAGGDAEYMDSEMKAKTEKGKAESKERAGMETAMAEPEENAMRPRGRPKKYGRKN
jgi:hypothetical protein